MTEHLNEAEARREALSPLLEAADLRPMSSLVRVEVAARSHRGAVRPSNDTDRRVQRGRRSVRRARRAFAAYLFRDGQLTQLTRDHTMAWHCANTGRPARVARATQDLQHILTDTIGGLTEGPLVDVDHVRLVNGDNVLLCTNGLTDMVSEDRIAEVLAQRRAAREQCELLVDLALQAGGKDNVTVTLAQYDIPPESSR